MTSKTDARPLLCRLNLHHEWVRRTTEDGARFRQCARCGKDDYRGSGPPPGTVPSTGIGGIG